MNHGLDFSQAHVIITDDTGMMRAMHKKYLTELGFLVTHLHVGEDGEQGLTLLKNLIAKNMKPTLIISDWDMPKITGIQFLKEVRSKPETQDITFVMVTGHEKPDDYPQLIKLKVNGIIVKPFKPELYNQKIVEIMSKALMNQLTK
jgi:two-component system chemotaxis response regulator CheY